jgi:hypothetical protein
VEGDDAVGESNRGAGMAAVAESPTQSCTAGMSEVNAEAEGKAWSEGERTLREEPSEGNKREEGGTIPR